MRVRFLGAGSKIGYVVQIRETTVNFDIIDVTLQLRDLLEQHLVRVRRDDGRETALDIQSVLFIVNKMDTIKDEEERRQTKDHVVSSIRKIWGGIREEQIIFISAGPVSVSNYC